ncbi:hypothetical protein D7030_02395 [Flavobacteriaceae bacterium AU392]|nr:hypothetical protein D1817_08870 [Flavobacteriaceae bacterium]RKM85546.1 hypothetical protein D7030_02395 [Flavobacteriaceae bacterium AU392]
MRIFLQCIIILIFFFGNAQEKEWKLVKDIERGYRINFPGEAKYASQKVPTDKGDVTMDSYSYQPENLEADNLVYMTAFTKYPTFFFENGLESDENKQRVLDNAVNGAVTNTKGTLASSDKIKFNGYPGRRSKINISGGYVIEMKTILVNFTLYLAQVIYKKEDEGNFNASRFFNSFELIKVNE